MPRPQASSELELRRELEEVGGEARRGQPTFAEDKTGEQVRRDRTDADAIRRPCEHGEPDGDGTELDERERDVVGRRPEQHSS